MLFKLLYWVFVDLVRWFRSGRVRRPPFGLWLYVGLPGKGKTISIVEYLDRARRRYPGIKIYSNFYWSGQDGQLESWHDLVRYSNGQKGVIFAFDEVQNTFNQRGWKNFPPELLEQISYSRKDRKLIVGSTQDFDLVDVVIRRYANYVVRCNTLFNRLTFNRAFSRLEYESMLKNYASGKKAFTSWRYSFVQSDDLRAQFDTYARATKLVELAEVGELQTLADAQQRQVVEVPVIAPVVVREGKGKHRKRG